MVVGSSSHRCSTAAARVLYTCCLLRSNSTSIPSSDLSLLPRARSRLWAKTSHTTALAMHCFCGRDAENHCAHGPTPGRHRGVCVCARGKRLHRDQEAQYGTRDYGGHLVAGFAPVPWASFSPGTSVHGLGIAMARGARFCTRHRQISLQSIIM
jgi:hypothetical protein